MSYISPQMEAMARNRERGAKLDSYMKANGIPPVGYPIQAGSTSAFDDDYTGLPDDGFGQTMVDEPQEPRLKPISIADLFTNPSPPPLYIWDGYTPRGVVTLFGAHGGTGKSTIALMLAVCAVLGRPLFGVDTEPCSVLFVSLEDASSVVRHRLSSLCKAWLIDPVQLKDLTIVDGREHPELFTAETRGNGQVTGTFHELRALVESGSVGLVVIDNASDAFGGDEIQRRQVRAFMRELGKIATLTDSAVVLLAHVDKNTSRAAKSENSEGYSGSTAWHNSARSRLFLTRGKDDLLTLEHQKNNLGLRRDPITLQWLKGGFPQLVAGYEAPAGAVAQAERSDDQNAQELLRLIAEFEGRGQFCCPTVTARNNPFALLHPDPSFVALKLNKDDTRRIIDQCQRAGWLESVDYQKHRREHQRWTLTAKGRLFAGIFAPPALSAPSSHKSDDDAQSAEVAPSAPSSEGGLRGERCAQESTNHDANNAARSLTVDTKEGAPPEAETHPTPPAQNKPTNPNEEF